MYSIGLFVSLFAYISGQQSVNVYSPTGFKAFNDYEFYEILYTEIHFASLEFSGSFLSAQSNRQSWELLKNLIPENQHGLVQEALNHSSSSKKKKKKYACLQEIWPEQKPK